MTTAIYDERFKCAYDKLVDIDVLQPNPKNPNKHPDRQIEMLAKIIKYQGQRAPIVVSNRSGFITKGHGRLMALKKLGFDKAAVDYQDYEDEAQEYADMVADNKIAELAEHDDKFMTDIILSEFPDIDLELLGLDDFKLEMPFEGKTDEDAVPDDVPARAKLGDIYQLGNHRLMCGDSTDKATVEQLMNGEKADMVFTDPPYNQSEYGGKNDMIGRALHKQTASISHMIDFDPKKFLEVLPGVFDNKMNSYVFTSKDLLPDYLGWAKGNGYSFNVLVWKKPNAIPIGGSHRPDVEYLLVFRKSGLFNSGVEGVNYSKVIECGRETGLHPTMKPVQIIENQIKIGSNNSVCDLFGGSGSTLIACEKTNRKCFMMELDPHYVDVIIKRWEDYTGRKAELISSLDKTKPKRDYDNCHLRRTI